jgi:hypothetical protein
MNNGDPERQAKSSEQKSMEMVLASLYHYKPHATTATATRSSSKG